MLADIYNRQGRAREGAEELARGRALEASHKKREQESEGPRPTYSSTFYPSSLR